MFPTYFGKLPIKVNCLVGDQPYLITCVEHCDTRYGSAVLLIIQKSVNSLKKLFLPRRYSNVIIDEELKTFGLVYMDVCPQMKGYLFAISGE
jgi:hypothetical protein